MSVGWAMFLGLIQGLTEFLPVSSSGHLSVIQNLFNMDTAEGGHMLFDVLLHLATLISVCIVYKRDIKAMILDVAGAITAARTGRRVRYGDKEGESETMPPARRLIILIIIATLPLLIVLPFKSKIELLYYNTAFIGIALLLTGTMLFVSDKMPRGRKTEKNMTGKNALVVGLCQAVAVIPGLSRSGTTITAGLATGLSREFAVRFSFLMSLPAVLGANIMAIADAVKEGVNTSYIPAYLMGMLVAALVGCLAIGLVRMIARKGKFGYFAFYCWFAGIVTIILTIVL